MRRRRMRTGNPSEGAMGYEKLFQVSNGQHCAYLIEGTLLNLAATKERLGWIRTIIDHLEDDVPKVLAQLAMDYVGPLLHRVEHTHSDGESRIDASSLLLAPGKADGSVEGGISDEDRKRLKIDTPHFRSRSSKPEVTKLRREHIRRVLNSTDPLDWRDSLRLWQDYPGYGKEISSDSSEAQYLIRLANLVGDTYQIIIAYNDFSGYDSRYLHTLPRDELILPPDQHLTIRELTPAKYGMIDTDESSFDVKCDWIYEFATANGTCQIGMGSLSITCSRSGVN